MKEKIQRINWDNFGVELASIYLSLQKQVIFILWTLVATFSDIFASGSGLTNFFKNHVLGFLISIGLSFVVTILFDLAFKILIDGEKLTAGKSLLVIIVLGCAVFLGLGDGGIDFASIDVLEGIGKMGFEGIPDDPIDVLVTSSMTLFNLVAEPLTAILIEMNPRRSHDSKSLGKKKKRNSDPQSSPSYVGDRNGEPMAVKTPYGGQKPSEKPSASKRLKRLTN